MTDHRNSERIGEQEAAEFVLLLSIVANDRLRDQGLTHSISTGHRLPDGPLRTQIAVVNGGLELLWGVAGIDEPMAYDYPELGYQVPSRSFDVAMRELGEQIDQCLLRQCEGAPVVRRLTSREYLALPQAPRDAAILLRGATRRLLPHFPWQPGDRFAITGRLALEAARVSDLLMQSRASIVGAPGLPTLVLVDAEQTAQPWSAANA